MPQRAVTELQGRYTVAVVGEGGKVSLREVKPGDKVGSLWVVNEGLKAGDRVVAEGTQKVREGHAGQSEALPGGCREGGA